jgi:hypothetical protein
VNEDINQLSVRLMSGGAAGRVQVSGGGGSGGARFISTSTADGGNYAAGGMVGPWQAAIGVSCGNSSGGVFISSGGVGGSYRNAGHVLSDGLSYDPQVGLGSPPIRVTRESDGSDAVDILDRIDRAVGNLCPCGAEPDPQFAPYCGDDCRPNYRSQDTSSDYDRTQMHWRPDLVTVEPDEELVSWLPRRSYKRGWVEVFERPGTDRLHVRMDDDYRYVGTDFERSPEDTFHERYKACLQRLLAELDDERRVVAGPANSQAWHARPAAYGALERHLLRAAAQARETARAATAALMVNLPAAQVSWRTLDLMTGGMAAAWSSRPAPAPADSVATAREEILRRVREARNAGPAQPARPPRRLDPRRQR